MAQGCLKCLKYTMCVANFLCFVCGVVVSSFGVYSMVNFNFSASTPSSASLNIPSMLSISGIIITCVSFSGFLGASKENRCLLSTFFSVIFLSMVLESAAACSMLVYEAEIGKIVTEDLNNGLQNARNVSEKMSDWGTVQETFKCCGVHNASDWGGNTPDTCCETGSCTISKPYTEGCMDKSKTWFEENFLTTGISVIVICIIEVSGMCFAMTLFCHISRSGSGYKL